MTVAIQFLITFSSFFLENKNFVTFEVFENGSGYGSTVNGRRTHFYITVVSDQHHAVEFHLGSFFSLKALNIDSAVFFNLELLPGYFYDCVHFDNNFGY